MASRKDKAAYNRQMAKFEERFTKSFGEDAIEDAEVHLYEVISTGSLALDFALGVGGYVEGRIVELWGANAIGKTTLALIGLAEAQRKYPDKQVAWVDMEGTLDRQWAKDHGVNLAMMKVFTPSSAEEAADAVKMILQSGLFSMVVFDSIGAMIAEKQLEKDAGDSTVGIVPKIVTEMVNSAAIYARESSTVFLVINQIRASIGGYGPDTDTPGGYALKHVTTMKLKLRGTATTPFTVKLDGEQKPVEVGREIAVYSDRNKVAPPKRTATVSLFHTSSAKYGPVGVDVVDEAFTVGVRTKVIEQGGGGYYTLHTGERLRGRDAVVDALREQPQIVQEIRTRALATIAEQVVDDSEETEDDGEVTDIQEEVKAKGRFQKAVEANA